MSYQPIEGHRYVFPDASATSTVAYIPSLNPALYPANAANRASRRARNTANRQRAERAEAQAQAGVTQPPLVLAASRAEERFQAFMRLHPEVFMAFRQRAQHLRERGKRHISADSICHYLRDETPIDARTGQDIYKINNNWSSRFARLLITEDPSFSAYIETRKLRSA